MRKSIAGSVLLAAFSLSAHAEVSAHMNFSTKQFAIENFSYIESTLLNGEIATAEFSVSSFDNFKNRRDLFYLINGNYTSNLMVLAPGYSFRLSPLPGITSFAHECLGGVTVPLKTVDVEIVSAQKAIKIAQIRMNNDVGFTGPAAKVLTDLSLSKPWHPGYNENCKKLADRILHPSLEIDGTLSAKANFAKAKCGSYLDHDGSLFGTTAWEVTQKYNLTVFDGLNTVAHSEGKVVVATPASKAECKALEKQLNK